MQGDEAVPRSGSPVLEVIADRDIPLAYLIRAAASSAATNFFTSETRPSRPGSSSILLAGRSRRTLTFPSFGRSWARPSCSWCGAAVASSTSTPDDRRLVASRELMPGDAVLVGRRRARLSDGPRTPSSWR